MSAHYLLLIITLCSGPAAATDLLHFEGHFRQWYAGYRELGPALLSNCSTEYEVFRAQSDGLLASSNLTVDSTSNSRFIDPLLICLLAHMNELDKVQTAVSSVILALLPTLLVFTSSSGIELGLLAQCRPFLTFLLAAASPALNPIRRDEYYSGYILTQPGNTPSGNAIKAVLPVRRLHSALVSLLEYILVLAAIANIIHNTWQLTTRTVSALAPQSAFQPLCWVLGALLGHGFEICSFAQRIVCTREERKERGRGRMDWFWNELQTCSVHKPMNISYRPENMIFRVTSWVCNKYIILFITWATFFFSSILFLTIGDAMTIFVRYLFSVIVSRLILQYELDGMSLVTKVPDWMQD